MPEELETATAADGAGATNDDATGGGGGGGAEPDPPVDTPTPWLELGAEIAGLEVGEGLEALLSWQTR